jgi:hypothetical protein
MRVRSLIAIADHYATAGNQGPGTADRGLPAFVDPANVMFGPYSRANSTTFQVPTWSSHRVGHTAIGDEDDEGMN